MNRVIVGVADLAVSRDPNDVIITYSLGSCIAVVLYDPKVGVGGMLHYMLPESSTDPVKAQTKPAMFADSGIPLLFKETYKYGAKKKSLIVKVVGGAQILDEDGVFNIGKRNYMMLRKIFWKNNVLIAAEHVGGKVNRTVRLEMATGRVFLKVSGLGEFEL
ncbi:MAG: chemotaxis protein CheD [Desulfosoma sp.]|uniref:chemotaxis protein CheD n=1 Tax=Desulfosoma sp. TaxID=2603217 RepID=UPI00404985CE